MLFYCVWPDEASFLVDVADEATARKAAIEEVGKAPSSVRPFPVGIFGARVYFEDDADAELEALPHVLDVLEDLEDALTPPANANVVPIVTCVSEAEDDGGKVVRCELGAKHDGDHKAGALTWPNEQKRTG